MPQLQPPKPKQQFPPIPEFYGGEPGQQVAPPPTDVVGWPPTQSPAAPKMPPLLEAIMALLRHFNMGITTKQQP